MLVTKENILAGSNCGPLSHSTQIPPAVKRTITYQCNLIQYVIKKKHLKLPNEFTWLYVLLLIENGVNSESEEVMLKYRQK